MSDMARGNLPTQADVDEIDQRLRELAEEAVFLKARKKTMLLAAWDIGVGDTVRYTGQRWEKGMLGQVSEVRAPYGINRDRPWVMVRKQKKDGTFGGSPIHFFSDWEKVTALAAASSGQTGEG